jgi:predicted DNA-binding transcriptional regulator AlpA
MTPAPRLDGTVKPKAALQPEGTTLADALRELVDILPGLKAPIEHKPRVGRLALRFDEPAAALGVSRRLLERELSAGRFPRADLRVGRCPLWRPATIERWLDEQGGNRR